MAKFTDPVCGMMVHEEDGILVIYEGKSFHFCSEFCRQAFQSEPSRYAFYPEAGTLANEDVTRRIAYFSMEVAVESKMPNYSGGLGILAGDTLKSFADLRLPVVGVSLLYQHGYFEQHLDEGGTQQEKAVVWYPEEFATMLPTSVTINIEGRSVTIGVWQYDVYGVTEFHVPLLLLDTNLEENHPKDRELTGWLYGGDDRYRLAQEAILGIGGLRILQVLGYTAVERFHMNEGHAALLVLELLRQDRNGTSDVWNFDDVRKRCVFTTHTPVPAGHDQFPYDLFTQVTGDPIPRKVTQMLGGHDKLNMTLLALNISRYVNGVAKKHREVSREMFPGYPIHAITNGVHSRTWTCRSFHRLYDRFIPGWGKDPFSLRYALGIPREDIWAAHAEAKAQLIEEVASRTGKYFKHDVLTLGFARRATPYKRTDLLFHDPARLLDIAKAAGPIQVLFAGKAHPKDPGGKELIRRIVTVGRDIADQIHVAYLENYDMDLGLMLTSGVDVWLNTPLRPLEASGTSGMKAAHNGVPSLSVLDGWWIEGHIEGITGWSIGPEEVIAEPPEETNLRDAEDLYSKLCMDVVPTFYNDRQRWTDLMRQTIAFNASFFNTHRMVQQYATNAYL